MKWILPAFFVLWAALVAATVLDIKRRAPQRFARKVVQSVLEPSYTLIP